MFLRRYKNLNYIVLLGVFYFVLLPCFVREVQQDMISSNASDPAKTNSTREQFISVRIRGQVQIYPFEHAPEIVPKELKYILVWTPKMNPFHLIDERQKTFIKNDCKYTNCFISHSKDYFKDQRSFDAIIFSGCTLRSAKHYNMPSIRSAKQKYIFASLEAAPFNPVTNPLFDNYFNWTWTYRMDSDISWKYITIHDLNDTIVGPAYVMKWVKNMKPIDNYFKKRLRRKTKAVAWFVSHCTTHSHREDVSKRLGLQLNKYGLVIDVFGACGQSSCSKSLSSYKMLERDYFFYLSFENAIEVDYVTEKLLTALRSSVVPIVYGGANYSRFLPPGSYLNANELGPEKLAKIMNDAIRNSSLYYEFFKWRNHYKYKGAEDASELCNLCAALNNEEMMTRTSTHTDFRLWWNGPVRQNTYDFVLKSLLSNDELLKTAEHYNFTRESSLALFKNIKNKMASNTKEFYLNVAKKMKSKTYGPLMLQKIKNNSSVLGIPTFKYNFTTTDSISNDSVSGTTADLGLKLD